MFHVTPHRLLSVFMASAALAGMSECTPLETFTQDALSAPAGTDLYFAYGIPIGSELVSFQLTNITGDADLYVSRGRFPGFGGEPPTYECESTSPAGQRELCVIWKSEPNTYYGNGTHHVTVRAVTDFENAVLTVSWRPPPPPPELALDDFLCLQRFTLDDGEASLVTPYCSSIDLSNPREHSQVKRVVFLVHGSGSNAYAYYERMLEAATAAGVEDETVIVAPQFLEEEHLEAYDLGDEYLYWSGSWRGGAISKSTESRPRPFRVSSYAVLDEMVDTVTEDFNLPNLEEVVVAGHSAGGQYVNRYAATHPDHSVDLRYVVISPASYVYFSPDRRVEGTVNHFEPLSYAEHNACPGYDKWKYGLFARYSYMSSLGQGQIQRRYGEREVIHLVGDQDNDPDGVQQNCEASVQGDHRLERARAYYFHTRRELGQYGAYFNHTFAIVPGVGHNSRGMFSSSCGLKFLFDADAECVEGVGAP